MKPASSNHELFLEHLRRAESRTRGVYALVAKLRSYESMSPTAGHHADQMADVSEVLDEAIGELDRRGIR